MDAAERMDRGIDRGPGGDREGRRSGRVRRGKQATDLNSLKQFDDGMDENRFRSFDWDLIQTDQFEQMNLAVRGRLVEDAVSGLTIVRSSITVKLPSDDRFRQSQHPNRLSIQISRSVIELRSGLDHQGA